MVKTRHSGDIDVESPPKFLSLSNEKNRQSTRSGDALVGGDDRNVSKTYREDRDAYNIFNEKVVESRLRPRIGPRRAYNYLDVESSDEDSLRRQTHHSKDFSSRQQMSSFTRSNRIKHEIGTKHRNKPRDRSRRTSSHEDQEQSIPEDGDDNSAKTRTKKSQSCELISDKITGSRTARRGSPTQKHQHSDSDEDDDEEEEEEDDDEIDEGRRPRNSRRQHDASEDEGDETDTLIRRSSRTRRQVYDTLNQSYLVRRPGQKACASEEGDQSDNKDQEDSEDNKVFSDMYSRVKRKRVQVKRNMYGVPINSDSDSEHDKHSRNKNNNKIEDDEDSQGNSDDNFVGDDIENQADSKRVTRRKMKKKEPTVVKSYSLREHKPRTNLYKAPVEERRIRRIHSIFAVTPTKKGANQTYHSPAQRRNIRKRSAFHSSSGSTSSSASESSDEKNFKHRKAKSMAKARSRMMPMNFSSNALPPSNIIKDRVKSGASLADVEPMNIDRNVTFSSIGGLGKHIRALKEMVVFPLLYDKVFQRFKVDPPRGVLFYGPPGTGKTLVARALANECSHGDRRVAFFMRKGADCLSKWVGESERQLRLLFDQAYKFRPSIIFFDEIDGLAPVRSSRQDQIHSSIVSTLLALMDGLDSRGEIVVIGATNRIDSLDPALRRPGRFDREFLFSLPSLEARKQILNIHTASWTPKLNEQFISELAEKCVGYCGADLKALVTEAAMLALRRRYPQIYFTNEALQLDVTSINVSARDFFDAVNNIIPTSQRSANSPARALPPRVYHLLHRQFNIALKQLSDTFPPCLAQSSTSDMAATSSQVQILAENGIIWDELASDEDEDTPSIFVTPSNKGKALRRNSDQGSSKSPTYLKFSSSSRPSTFRPRLMIVGHEGQGQTTYIAPAIIHKMENLPVHVLDLPALYAITAKTPEESCANVFHEAKRKCPSIIYLPYINQWWDVMAETLRATLLTLIHDLNPSLPLLLLATSEQPYAMLDPVLQSLFSRLAGEVMEMKDPNSDERRTFFKDLLLDYTRKPPPQKKQAAQRILEVLPKAAPPKPRELTQQELDQLVEKEELTLMELRIFLRDVLNKLGSDKKFSIFAKPVNREEAPDYYEIIENPMDLSTMMAKIDLHEYGTVRAFMNDIDFICSNALEYNPNRGPMDRVIRHRACALKDTAYAIIKTELDKDFEKMCVEIEESRKRRGEKSTTVPNFYCTKPNTEQQSSRSQTVTPRCMENLKQTRTIPKPEGERFSRRVRGLNIDPVPPLEAVEKVFKMSRVTASPHCEDNKNNSNEDSSILLINESDRKILEIESRSSTSGTNISTREERLVNNGPKTTTGNKLQSPALSASKSKKRKQCVWCKPKRKRMRFTSKSLTSNEVADERQEYDVNAEDSGEETSLKATQETDVHQQLRIEIAEQESESKEQKSPARSSTRLKSPVTSSTVRVSTRRSSMSPCNTINVDFNTSNQSQDKYIETTKDNNNQTQQLSIPVDREEKSDSTMNENPLGTNYQTEAIKQPVSINLHTTEPSDKPSVVKRLDLDLVAMDSGVGSSVDSNGDSRDSTDHNREGTNSLKSSSAISTINDLNQNSNSEMTSRASAILDKPIKEMIIDVNRLTSLLNRLVARTDGYNVDRLEKIYSHLNQVIYRHRQNYNRTGMILELEKKVEELTKIVSQSSSNVHQ